MHRVWIDEQRNSYSVETRLDGGILTRDLPGVDEAEALERAKTEYPNATHKVLRKTQDVGYIPLTEEEEREADIQERREYEIDVLQKALAIAEHEDVREALQLRLRENECQS